MTTGRAHDAASRSRGFGPETAREAWCRARARRRPDLARLLPLLVLLACGDGSAPSPATPGSPRATDRALELPREAPPPLVPGEPVEIELEAEGEAWLSLDLAAGEAAILVAGQRDADVALEIVEPSGGVAIAYDTPVSRFAPERLCFVAREEGLHRLRLTHFEKEAVTARLELAARRPASAADREHAAAGRELMHAIERQESEGRSLDLVPAFRRSVEHAKAAGEPFLAALALRELGAMQLKLGRSTEAAATFERAHALAERAESEYLVVGVLNRWGLARHDLGELGAAVELFAGALARARAAGDAIGEGEAENNLGLAELAAGDPHRAIERFERVLAIWEEQALDRRRTVTLENLATAHGLLDHHERALELLEDGLELAARLGDRERQAGLLVAEGWIHHLRGEPAAGIPRMTRALELYRALEAKGAETAVLDRLATLHRAAGEPERARKLYERSLALSEAAGSPWDAASTYANLGCLAEESETPERALELLAEARERFASLDDPKALAHIDYCRAQALRRLGEREAAIEALERALAVVAGLRASARRSGNLYSPIWLWQDYAELHVELLLEHAEATGETRFARRAFEAGDLARARNLYELVLESAVGVRFSAGEALLERELELGARLNRARERLRSVRAPAERGQIEREIGALSLELERARAAIRAADPRYAELVDPRPVRVEELQRLLAPGSAVLAYRLGEGSSHLFTVTAEGFEVRGIEPRGEIEASARSLYENLRRAGIEQLQLGLLAESLSGMLLPPGAIPEGTKRLLIVADGMLHYLPLAVLPEPGDPSAGSRLVERYEIGYLPSASVLAALRRRDGDRVPPPREVAVFADPVYTAADARLGGEEGMGSAEGFTGGTRSGAAPPADPRALGGARDPALERLPQGPLPRLPWTGVEARSIADRVAPDEAFAALGFEASKATVESADLGLYRHLHFATHALIDERFPELSGMVLSRRDEAGRAIDGDLSLHEVYTLDVAAELVTLSGCQTALGRRVRGDGLLGLTRGFLYAGASQLLVSLWPVDDRATARLMDAFYAGLLDRGESPAAALRAAQLELAASERWSHPYYWAAFVLQGADR